MTVVVVLFGLCGVAAAQAPDAAPPASGPAPDAAPEAAVPATKAPVPTVETPSADVPSVPSPQAPPPPAESPPAESPPPRTESTSPAAQSPPAKSAPAESGRAQAAEPSDKTERRRHAGVEARPTIAPPPVFPQRVVAVDDGPPLSTEARLAALALLMAAAGSLGLVRHLRRWTVQ